MAWDKERHEVALETAHRIASLRDCPPEDQFFRTVREVIDAMHELDWRIAQKDRRRMREIQRAYLDGQDIAFRVRRLWYSTTRPRHLYGVPNIPDRPKQRGFWGTLIDGCRDWSAAWFD